MHLLRRIGALLCITWSAPASAQQITGIDFQGLPKPLQTSAFASLEASRGPDVGELTWGIRASYLWRPLSLRAPSPDASSSDASLVEGAVLAEFSAGLGLGKGFDLGLGMGAHVFQWGHGNDAASGGDPLPAFGARDPRIGLGWTTRTSNASLRPFVTVSLPFGNQEAWAGESKVRTEVGAAVSLESRAVLWTSQLSILFRPAVPLSSTTWGTQARLLTGVRFALPQNLGIGAELVLAPVLVSQEREDGAAGGVSFPAEALGSASWKNGRTQILAGAGSGLPFSTPADVDASRAATRGPTAPLLRSFVELAVAY